MGMVGEGVAAWMGDGHGHECSDRVDVLAGDCRVAGDPAHASAAVSTRSSGRARVTSSPRTQARPPAPGSWSSSSPTPVMCSRSTTRTR